jgi:hypothetical protein
VHFEAEYQVKQTQDSRCMESSLISWHSDILTILENSAGSRMQHDNTGG